VGHPPGFQGHLPTVQDRTEGDSSWMVIAGGASKRQPPVVRFAEKSEMTPPSIFFPSRLNGGENIAQPLTIQVWAGGT